MMITTRGDEIFAQFGLVEPGQARPGTWTLSKRHNIVDSTWSRVWTVRWTQPSWLLIKLISSLYYRVTRLKSKCAANWRAVAPQLWCRPLSGFTATRCTKVPPAQIQQ